MIYLQWSDTSQLKCLAILLPCHLSLITIHILHWCQFSDIHISQGCVVTYLSCGRICKDEFVANLPPILVSERILTENWLIFEEVMGKSLVSVSLTYSVVFQYINFSTDFGIILMLSSIAFLMILWVLIHGWTADFNFYNCCFIAKFETVSFYNSRKFYCCFSIVKIVAAEILQFNRSSEWRPSTILDFQNSIFNSCTIKRLILHHYPNFMKSVKQLLIILQFFNSLDGIRHIGF